MVDRFTPKLAANVRDCGLAILQQGACMGDLLIGELWPPSSFSPACSCRSQAGPHPLADQVALHLGQCRQRVFAVWPVS
jgi:hypothetical protein